MIADFNLIPVVNLLFCVIIFILGLIKCCRSQDYVARLIGAAFGIFGVSHLLRIFGVQGPGGEALLIVIRAFAYLTVVVALCRKCLKD